MGKIFRIDFQFKNCTDSTTYNGLRSLNEKDIFVQHSRSGFFEILRVSECVKRLCIPVVHMFLWFRSKTVWRHAKLPDVCENVYKLALLDRLIIGNVN